MNPAVLLPMLILTWQAHSFVPTNYQAKILPPRDSTVDVYLEFIDGGRIASLDKNLIRWQVNGNFLAAGINLKHVSFQLDRYLTRSYLVTATIKEYSGRDYEKSVLIKRVEPLVVLSNSAWQPVPAGQQTEFTAEPFFFSARNASDFLFDWIVNGTAIEKHLNRLPLTVPTANAPQTLAVSVTASNRANEIETASANRKFLINN